MKILLIILIIYFLLMILGRYLFPFLLRRFIKKLGNKYAQQMPDMDNYYTHPKEGDVHINKNESAKNKSDKTDIGEYVDFEEIK